MVRSGARHGRLYLSTFLALALAASVTLAVATRFVIGVEPWWSPQYAMPLLGMVHLENAVEHRRPIGVAEELT